MKWLSDLLFKPDQAVSSWVDLDRVMRARLKRTVLPLSVVALIFTLLSVYVVLVHSELGVAIRGSISLSVSWDTLRENVGRLRLGQILLTLVLLGLVALVFIFGFLFFDVAKAHYRLDRLTFRLLKKTDRAITRAAKNACGCQRAPECALDKLLANVGGRIRFKRQWFYQFANENRVGGFNQEDIRKSVFDVWGNYYVFNSVMATICLLLVSAAVFAASIVGALTWWAALFFLPAIVQVGVWWLMGRAFQPKVTLLATEQIEGWCGSAADDVLSRLRSISGRCEVFACRL